MTKGYGDSLLRVAHAILADCMATFPGDRQELLRDQTRLSMLVKTRGLPFFTVDLPALGKHFDLCLSKGTYTCSSLPCSGVRWNNKPIPKLFSGLVLRVFDRDGMLRLNADVNAMAALRQLYYFAKKLKIDCERRKHYDAVQTFFSVEEELREPSLNWEDPQAVAQCAHDCHFGDRDHRGDVRHSGSDTGRHESNLHEVFQRVADILSTSLGSFEPGEWRPRHGPGAVSDLKAGENKYVFPTWTERLSTVFPYAEFAHANYGLWADSVLENGNSFDDEPSSRLISVPKTQKGPRLIAAEPVAHQWCQQIIWDYLETRVRSIFLGRAITFRDQSGNQGLARAASENGSHWTVDLSMASDFLSLWCVERFFRQNPSLLEALAASRTRFLSQEIDKKSPNCIELKKFSTMGSACTFPVQSIFFAGVALASICAARNLSPTRRLLRTLCREIQVFGDDIIVPEDSGEALTTLLRDMGFRINHDKTFGTGLFRESCGVDAYAGYDITPAYVTQVASSRRPESVYATVMQSNNFFEKGWWKASEAIRQTVAVGLWPIVHVSQGVTGWKSYVGSQPTNRQRWNESLQRTEFLCSILRTEQKKTPVSDWTALLQYFTEDPDPSLPWSSGVRQKPRLKLRRGWVALYDLGLTAEVV